jgi:hypothetical protein
MKPLKNKMALTNLITLEIANKRMKLLLINIKTK